MATVHYAVQVNLTDSTVASNSDFGLYSGYLRLVTDSPFYNGSTVIPTGDNEGDVWKNDILLKVSGSVCSIDIVDAGDYAALGDLEFTVDNTNVDFATPFWKAMEILGVGFTNREVKFYTVIDDVFYLRWTGIITTTSFETLGGAAFRFVCGDAYSKVHKIIPPDVLTKESFAEIGDDLIGEPIPISIGYVLARLYNVTSKPKSIPLGSITSQIDPRKTDLIAGAILAYVTPYDSSPYIYLITPNANFTENQLATGEYYLRGVKGTKQVIKIKGNEATTTDDSSNGTIGAKGFTKIYLDAPFEDVTEDSISQYGDVINSTQARYEGHTAVGLTRFTVSGVSGTFTPTNNPVQGPWILGETSGACGWTANGPAISGGTLGISYLKGAFLVGEKIYESTFKAYTATISGDVDRQIANFTSIKGFVRGTSTDGNQRVYVSIVDDGGGSRHVAIYRDHARSSLVGHTASYSTPGLKPIVADNGSALFGDINIGAVSIPVNITVTLQGINVGRSATITGIYTAPTSTRGVTAFSAYTTTWYFEIVKLAINFVVSSNSISQFSTASNVDNFVFFDRDLNKYIDVGDLVIQKSVDANNVFTKPFLTFVSDEIDYQGNIARYIYLLPDMVANGFFGTPVATPTLVDRDRSTYVTSTGNLTTNLDILAQQYRVYVPTTTKQFEALFLTADVEVVKQNSVECRFAFSFQSDYFDAYHFSFRASDNTDIGNDFTIPMTNFFGMVPDADYNFLPNSYYNNGGNDADEESLWNLSEQGVSFKSRFKVPVDILSTTDETLACRIIRFYVGVTKGKTTTASGLILRVKEIGFVGKKTIELGSGDLFARIKGETFDGEFVDTVPETFQHLFETYDGMSSSDYDLGNISTTRSDWYVGRQITDRKSSFDYHIELAKQSFVGIYPGLDGKRMFKSWRDDKTVLWTDNQNTINRNSITRFEKTPHGRAYNTFHLPYNWDPGREEFTRLISITNVDQSTFPVYHQSTGTDSTPAFTSVIVRPQGSRYVASITAATDILNVGDYVSLGGNSSGIDIYYRPVVSESSNVYTLELEEYSGVLDISSSSGTLMKHGTGVPKWTTFVSGIKNYTLSEYLWGLCHASYLKNQQIIPAPSELMTCHWYIDRDQFEPGTGGDDNNTAIKYVTEMCEWTTRQKDVVSYSVPITASNISRKLLDGVNFSDAIYTQGATRFGWITRIRINTATDSLDLDVMLDPPDVTTGTNIIESGLQPDTITESGSQPDTITEGA